MSLPTLPETSAPARFVKIPVDLSDRIIDVGGSDALALYATLLKLPPGIRLPSCTELGRRLGWRGRRRAERARRALIVVGCISASAPFNRALGRPEKVSRFHPEGRSGEPPTCDNAAKPQVTRNVTQSDNNTALEVDLNPRTLGGDLSRKINRPKSEPRRGGETEAAALLASIPSQIRPTPHREYVLAARDALNSGWTGSELLAELSRPANGAGAVVSRLRRARYNAPARRSRAPEPARPGLWELLNASASPPPVDDGPRGVGADLAAILGRLG